MSEKKLLYFISINYWKNHKIRLLSFICMLVLGVTALCSAALLIRSDKAATLEKELRLLGNYDLVIYDVDSNTIPKIAAMKDVDAIGSYQYKGYVSDGENDRLYKVAAFKDQNSEDIYHMTCFRGRYPQTEWEIAIDYQAARGLGIGEEIGATVTLLCYDEEKNTTFEKDYSVCGIFNATCEDCYGGWYRYPAIRAVGKIEMPSVFVHNSNQDFGKDGQNVVFLQTTADAAKLSTSLIEQFSEDIQYNDVDKPSGRSHAYAYVMGIAFSIWNIYGEMSIESVTAALRDGNVIKDFYSDVLVPVFSLLIFIVVFMSLSNIVKNILLDKKEHITIFRCIGCSRKQVFIYILSDIWIIGFCSILVGILISVILHPFIINGLNSFLSVKKPLAFHVDPTVASVTVNPFWFAFISVLSCMLLSSVIPLLPFLFSASVKVGKKERRTTRKIKYNHLYMKNYSSFLHRLHFDDKSVWIISILLMGACFFGYDYFCALSDSKSSQIASRKESSLLKDMDFVAGKSKNLEPCGYNIENRHEVGIDKNTFTDFVKMKGINYAFGEMCNLSTRIVLKNSETDRELESFLSPISMRVYSENEQLDSEYEDALKRMEQKIFNALGFADYENTYAVPSIYVSETLFSVIQKNIVAGEIDTTAFREGEEVILVTTKENAKALQKYFIPGDILPLNDILLNEKEEIMQLNYLTPEEIQDNIVFRENVTIQDGDKSYETVITGASFGRRKEIPTQIGALAIVDDEFAEKYLPELMEYTNARKANRYGIYAICGENAFSNWGLPDNKFTRIGVKLNSEYTHDKETATAWDKMVLGSEYMDSYSTEDLLRKINDVYYENMSIFYLMIFMLFLSGLFAITICLYSRVRFQGKKLAQMRAMGMKKSEICIFLWKRNLWYPVAGILFSVIPVAICQAFFDFIAAMIDNGIWGSNPFVTELPWYTEVPFRYSLFSYQTPWVMFLAFFIFEILIVFVTIPQIIYVCRQDIAKELVVNRF